MGVDEGNTLMHGTSGKPLGCYRSRKHSAMLNSLLNTLFSIALKKMPLRIFVCDLISISVNFRKKYSKKRSENKTTEELPGP